MNKTLKRIVITLLVLVIVWLGACFALLIISPKMIFKTEKSKNIALDLKPIQEFRTNAAGDSIDILWVPNDTAQLTYLYFHGNIGRLNKVMNDLQPYGNICAPTYPGYAKSTGVPTTENTYETVDIAIKFLKEKNIDLKNVIILGHSLGGSPAIYAAGKYPELKKVITVNTFHSITKMCENQYKILCLFSSGILNNASLAPSTKAPILLCHNPNDSLIPYQQGEELFKLIGSQQKEFRNIGGTHGVFDMAEVLK
ncbi:MAG: alpha/beta fold hydrolase [Bacteroidia bacterium]